MLNAGGLMSYWADRVDGILQAASITSGRYDDTLCVATTAAVLLGCGSTSWRVEHTPPDP